MKEVLKDIELGSRHLRMALDSRFMRKKLASILFPGEEANFHLRTLRAFPWTSTGGGVVEYEVSLRDVKGILSDKMILHAQLRAGKAKSSGKIKDGPHSTLSPEEREKVLSGKKTLSIQEPVMVLSTFPLDRRLRWLRELLDTDLMSELFQEELPSSFSGKTISITEEPSLLGYRYGRRCTLEYSLKMTDVRSNEQNEVHIIGKTYHDGRGLLTYEILEKLWNWSISGAASSPPLLARPLCYVPRYNIYFQEAKKGFMLSQIRVHEMREGMLKKTAETLSLFHNSGIKVDDHYKPDSEIDLIHEMNKHLMVIRPEFREISEAILASLDSYARDLHIREYVPQITHRDFYDKQVIIGLDGMYITDLDTVTMSDQSIDIGNFMAHIFLRCLQQGESKEDMVSESHLFLSSYQLLNPQIDVNRIMFYRSTSLFRLACLYAFRPMWSGLIRKLLGECLSQLNGFSGKLR